jgi:hypothetical protein
MHVFPVTARLTLSEAEEEPKRGKDFEKKTSSMYTEKLAAGKLHSRKVESPYQIRSF